MPDITLKVGQSVSVSAFIVSDQDDGYVPAPGNNISWISANPGVCIVDNASFVLNTNNTVSTTNLHAISNGTVTVTVLVNSTISSVINVTVNSPAPAIIEIVLGVPSP